MDILLFFLMRFFQRIKMFLVGWGHDRKLQWDIKKSLGAYI